MAFFRLYPLRQGIDPRNGSDVGSSSEQGDGVAVSVLYALLIGGMIMDKVTVVCYGTSKEWDNRQEAISFYSVGVMMCDGAEKTRYANILAQLISGLAVCSDK